MSLFYDWPEIAPVSSTEEPLRLHIEHAVWGKVHGARSDFRWIARSPGFPHDPDLPRQLNLGREDQPVRTQLWRYRHGRFYAVSVAPSRSADATGRTGFLEKQILAWEPPPGVPAALGALVLLPRVTLLTDEVWWGRFDEQSRDDPGFSLQLPTPDPVVIEESEIESTLFRGLEVLQTRLDPGALEAFYARLLGNAQPAGLTGLREPLPPEALAALLLPLVQLADRLSLAGWISGRASREDLALWNAVVVPPELSVMVDLAATSHEKARAWACRLLLLPEPLEELPQLAVPSAENRQSTEARPRRAVSPGPPGREIKLDPPPAACCSPLVKDLYTFACSVDRRWLAPESLRKKTQPGGHYDPLPPSLIPSWIKELEKQCPDGVDEDQWAVKLDLLRSAAMIFHAEPAVWKAVGLPKSGRIPALFFLPLRETWKQRDQLGAVGEAPLRQAIEHSLDCIPSQWTTKVRNILDQWLGQTDWRNPDIRRLIENAKRRPAQTVS